jgi:hypothetical protein
MSHWGRVFQAKLRLHLESTDVKLRSLLQRSSHKNGFTDIGPVLKKVREQSEDFWDEFPDAGSLLVQWSEWLAGQVNGSMELLSKAELKHHVWRTFIRRLSLETDLLKQLRGNAVLDLLLVVIEDTIYAQCTWHKPEAYSPKSTASYGYTPTDDLFGLATVPENEEDPIASTSITPASDPRGMPITLRTSQRRAGNRSKRTKKTMRARSESDSDDSD